MAEEDLALVRDEAREQHGEVAAQPARRPPEGAHRARQHGAARRHPGRLLRHADAAQPAREPDRPRSAPDRDLALRQGLDSRPSRRRSRSPISASRRRTTARWCGFRSRRSPRSAARSWSGTSTSSRSTTRSACARGAGMRSRMLKDLEGDGSATQDERHREEKKIQALTDEFVKKIDDLIAAEGRGDPPGLRRCAREPSGRARTPAATRADSAPRRHHHGRQWALGGEPRPLADRGPSRGSGGRARRGARRARARHPRADALRLLDRELEPAQGRGGRADAPARALPRRGARRGDAQRHPGARDRAPRQAAARGRASACDAPWSAPARTAR